MKLVRIIFTSYSLQKELWRRGFYAAKAKRKINLAISWLKPTAIDKNLNIFTSGK
jgi:hypothetical protein